MILGQTLDINGNIVQKIKFEPLASDPLATEYLGSTSGAIYYNTTSGVNRINNGSEWVNIVKINGTSGRTSVTYSGNPLVATVDINQALLDNYLPLSGGTMSGGLTLPFVSATNISATTITVGNVSNTEFQYLDTVSANIQNQLSNLSATKADRTQLTAYLPLSGGNVTGTVSATAFIDTNFVGNRALVSDSTGTIGESSVNNTELSYLLNVSANIQTQLNQLSQATVSGNGAGTPNRITKFVTSSSMGDSSITDTGSLVTFTTPVSGNNTITAPNFTGLASRATSALQADILKTARSFSLSGAATSTSPTFDGSANVVIGVTLTSGIDAAKIADGSVSNTEFQYINTLSANAQNQINNLSSISHTHSNKSTLDLINQDLNTSATVKFDKINLSDGTNIGSTGNTDWVKVADFPDTATGSSRKYYISILGGDWTDNANIEYAFDTYSTGASQSAINIKRIDSTWRTASSEIYNNLEWKVLRDNSTNDYMVFVRGTSVDFFNLAADVKYSTGTQGIFQYYSTVSADINLPTSATHTEVPTTVSEQPIRTLQDSLFIRNNNNTRAYAYDYTDTSAVAEVIFNGTQIYPNYPYNLGATTKPWKDVRISGTYYDSSFTGGLALVTDSNKGIVESSVTSAQINYLNTTSANIQTQLSNLSASDTTINNRFNSYLPLSGGNISGNLSAINISASTLTVGNISNTEFNYLDTVSANIQTQLNNLKNGTSTRFSSAINIAYGTQSITVNHNLGYLRPNVIIIDEGSDQEIIVTPVYISTSQLVLPITTSQAFTGAILEVYV